MNLKHHRKATSEMLDYWTALMATGLQTAATELTDRGAPTNPATGQPVALMLLETVLSEMLDAQMVLKGDLSLINQKRTRQENHP